ncbi:hypothetical protein KTC96_06285 [Clostridium estertheticum]|uniref:hypothetical protein n=1 Tax=Clostridium estertheticum TaxID=238834 RepID=UPI001C7CD7D8|nr:hypothetical protein [Clostridium estertheticum]MBX4262604.1 hypothetical protein [Clostridium estertheticum]WLC71611.1 hypothetical protein KTC96_06285 [Clostridium estertheticum]
MEFLERLKNIVINFNDLTSEEKLLLKGWIKDTTNSNEIYNMNELVDNTFNGLSDYYTDKIRSLPEGVIDKIATDIFDLETVEDIKNTYIINSSTISTNWVME